MEGIRFIQKKTFYSLELKHKVCKEHIEAGVSLSDLTRKYNLSCHSLIHDWLRRLGYLPPTYRQISRGIYVDSLNSQTMIQNFRNDPNQSKEELSEIAKLKKQLEDTQIQLEGYKRMIEIAENELKIPIQKKYNTK